MSSKLFLPVYALVILVVTASCAGTPSVPVGTTGTQIIQPGAPGEMAQAFDTAELEAIGGLSHSEADVRFMRGMIPHHGQALDMTALERWLTEREEDIPPPNAHRMMMAGDMALMPGMLSAGQMEQLTSATGQEFERLFLEFMIMHHEGALTMVQTLFNSSGAGQESLIFKFATDVDADQTIEIMRMRRMLEERR